VSSPAGAGSRLEHRARVEDVAGLGEAARRVDGDRARVRAGERAALLGVGRRGALDDRAGVLARGREQRVEPRRLRAAVVVGEGDQRRPRRPPSEVALARRAALPGRDAQLPRQHRMRQLVLVVVHDDHLEALARKRLRGERVEQPREADAPRVRGHDDADLGHARSPRACSDAHRRHARRGAAQRPGAIRASGVSATYRAPAPSMLISATARVRSRPRRRTIHS
jgi:hypothetical protein